jgi:peptidyl-prolyl cis-trans isomerase SurA
LFETSNKKNLEETTRIIKQSIKEIGFKNTANIYSISDSSKFGGDVGWIEEKNFSKNIFKKLINLNIGEYTTPLQTGNLFLILKIEDTKYEKKKIDQKKELKQKIEFETNRQLAQYSKIYYNKVKINIIINEL